MKKSYLHKHLTVVGSPHYQSPEMIQGLGYTKSIDFWSIGICLYEMMLGFVPFGQN